MPTEPGSALPKGGVDRIDHAVTLLLPTMADHPAVNIPTEGAITEARI